LKICYLCKLEKDRSFFSKNKTKKDGYRSSCKDCDKIQSKTFKDKNPNYYKDYYQVNKKEIILKQLEYYHTHKEQLEPARKSWRLTNKNKLAMASKKWVENNPEKNRNKAHKRRAKALENGIYFVSEKELKKLYSSKCFYCKKDGNIEADHVVPIHIGGTHSIGNLVPACMECNRSKGKKPITVWNKEKLRSKNGTNILAVRID